MMQQITTTYNRLISLQEGLNMLTTQLVKPIQISNCIDNLNAIGNKLNEVNGEFKASNLYSEYARKLSAINSIKGITDENKFDMIAQLIEEYREPIANRKTQLCNYFKTLDENVEIKLHFINVEDLPELSKETGFKIMNNINLILNK